MNRFSRIDPRTEKERQYDNINNEGGEGYNPYRAERQKQEAIQARNQYAEDMKRPEFERQEITEKLAYLDWNDPMNKVRVNNLRARAAELDIIINENKFKQLMESGWTPEITQQRREKWNAAIKAGEATSRGKVDMLKLKALRQKMGFNESQLQEAVEFWKEYKPPVESNPSKEQSSVAPGVTAGGLDKPQITEQNVKEYIKEGVIYRSSTPSGWAMFRTETSEQAKDDPLSFSHSIDLPEVQPLLDKLNKEKQDNTNSFKNKFQDLVSGMILLKDVNRLDYDIRKKYNLYQEPGDKRILSSGDGKGLWYHGSTTIDQSKEGRIKVAYGGSYDIYVKPDDPAIAIIKPKQLSTSKPALQLPAPNVVRIESQRSKLSQSRDASRAHSIIITEDNPKVKKWVRDPGSMDVLGVDTPPNINQTTERISKRESHITRRSGSLGSKMPRISQRTPRIK